MVLWLSLGIQAISMPPVPATNKFKLFNDPIYGFISLPSERIFDLVEHPYVQRLRRISQLGLSYLVYPGAYHTRFHHALGAMHLMQKAIQVLRRKGVEITDSEAESAQIAILLHDVGHGPFSHALEHTLLDGVHHETVSRLIMRRLNDEFGGTLDEAIAIFEGSHPKRFLHELISSQLDMDRMDYLKRDAFYTGVIEGAINSDRLLEMLHVADGQLVLEHKAITSIEKFLMSRSMMYWQVYMHKTVLSAEYMLVEVLRRASLLAQSGEVLFAGTELALLLRRRPNHEEFTSEPELLELFTQLDDSDILSAIKQWQRHSDPVLSALSRRIIERKLFRIKFLEHPMSVGDRAQLESAVAVNMGLTVGEARHFVLEGIATNKTYASDNQEIKLLKRNGQIIPLTQASEILPLSVYSQVITRPFVCWPKELPWIH
jgi:HD superfamily phosphohydrolase